MGVERRELRFPSAGDACAGWLYRPQADGPAPCVVMAHGFSLTRHDGLPAYAERLASAGAAVLAFDYRYLGDSGGLPRQRLRTAAQMQDWRAAVAYARTLEGVDERRIVLWGFSSVAAMPSKRPPPTRGSRRRSPSARCSTASPG